MWRIHESVAISMGYELIVSKAFVHIKLDEICPLNFEFRLHNYGLKDSAGLTLHLLHLFDYN